MFEKFQSIPRLNKDILITEKIDGTNAQVHILYFDDPEWDSTDLSRDSHYVVARDYDNKMVMFAGSRQRYVTPDADNYGFAQWVLENANDLFKFGPGRHYGEWWGNGIQRGYDRERKYLSMFNPKWTDQGPDCVDSVPVLIEAPDMSGIHVAAAMRMLKDHGSLAAPGFMDPEGIVVYHTGGNQYFKQTFDFDEGKWSEDEGIRIQRD